MIYKHMIVHIHDVMQSSLLLCNIARETSSTNLLDLLGEFTGGGKDEGLAVGDGQVKTLEDTNGEGGSLSGTRLSLGDDVHALHEGHNGTLLNGRGLLETISIDTTEQVFQKVHVVEVINNFLIVTLELLFHEVLILDLFLPSERV